MTTAPLSAKKALPTAFIWRRLHSVLGFWLVIYLCQHLFVNSQAAFFYKDDGKGFVSLVNRIHALPYLPLIEWVLLGLPFLIHGIWGLKYALQAKTNSRRTNGSAPSLPQYGRNRAYTWQRITSWILFVGIALHVFQMRIFGYPIRVEHGRGQYLIWVKSDSGLPLVAEKLNIKLYDQSALEKRRVQLQELDKTLSRMDTSQEHTNESLFFALTKQKEEEQEWLQGAEGRPLKKGYVIASSPNAGGAFFLMVREVFSNPIMVALYTLLVIGACFHAFNGLWTFMIKWGVTMTRRAQRGMLVFANILMGIVMIIGLLAVWGPYLTTVLMRHG